MPNIPVVTPTKNPTAPRPTQSQRLRTAATRTPVILYVVYTALIAGIALLMLDDIRVALLAMGYYLTGSVALYVAKGSR